MNKQTMCNALYAFINQRSGMDWRDYGGSREAFMADYRPMLRHGRQARLLLRAVELRDSITADALVKASRAYSGRLQYISEDYLREKHGINTDYTPRWEYTTGQYFPTEYRKAACAVLAQCLWDFWQPDCKTADEIRKQACREFGLAIARTWFN